MERRNSNRFYSKKYYISVEGNTEKIYFERLKYLINTSKDVNKKFNVAISTKVCKSPIKHLKKINILNEKIELFHVLDYEGKNEERNGKQLEKAILEIDEIVKSNSSVYKSIDGYEIGYTNLAFELWIILHKSDYYTCMSTKAPYLIQINKYFKVNFQSHTEFTKEKNLEKVINQIELEDIINAVKRGERIRKKKIETGGAFHSHGDIKFYMDNPDITIHDVVKKIIAECGLYT